MADDIKELKKTVTEDWQNAFPQLVKYAQNKFYKILDSVIIGVELINLPREEGYRPHFVCYPLWKENLKLCFDKPIISKEFYDRKGFQFSIPYTKHRECFSDALKAVRKQIPLEIEGDVSLKKIFSIIGEYSKTPPLSAAPNSYLQAVLYESKLEIALLSGSEKQIEDVLKQIKKISWDIEHFSLWKIEYDKWAKSIEDKVNIKDKLLSQLNTNREENKLSKLMQSKIV